MYQRQNYKSHSPAPKPILRVVREGGPGDELPVVEQYRLWMLAVGKRNRWITESLGTIRRLCWRSGKPIEEIVEHDIILYLARPEFAQRTKNSYYVQLNRFYHWWADHDGVNVMARIPAPKLPRGVPRPPSNAAVARLLAIETTAPRRAMVLLALCAGLRAFEIASIRGEDVDLDSNTITVLDGKGAKDDVLPLHPEIAAIARQMPRRGWWFPSVSRTGHFHGQTVSFHQSRLMREAEMAGTPHSLRHWFGTNLVATGADLRTAQVLLRHVNLTSTQIYVAASDEQRSDAINRLSLPTQD